MNLLVDDQQIRVATYYGARVKDMFTREGYHYLIISQHPHTFYLKIKAGHRFELKSPQSGKMNGYVEESLNALAVLLVYKKKLLSLILLIVALNCLEIGYKMINYHLFLFVVVQYEYIIMSYLDKGENNGNNNNRTVDFKKSR